jgi:hypothetical protein
LAGVQHNLEHLWVLRTFCSQRVGAFGSFQNVGVIGTFQAWHEWHELRLRCRLLAGPDDRQLLLPLALRETLLDALHLLLLPGAVQGLFEKQCDTKDALK